MRQTKRLWPKREAVLVSLSTVDQIESTAEHIERETAQTVGYDEIQRRYNEAARRKKRRLRAQKRRLQRQREQIKKLTMMLRTLKARAAL